MKMSPLFVLTLALAGCPKPIPIEEFSLVLEASEDWEPRECEHHDARVDLIEIKLPEYLPTRLSISAGQCCHPPPQKRYQGTSCSKRMSGFILNPIFESKVQHTCMHAQAFFFVQARACTHA